MSDAGHIAAEVAASAAESTVVMASAVVPVTVEVVVMRVMPVVAVITPAVMPVGIPAPIAIVVGVTPIPVPTPVAAPIGAIAPSVIVCRVVIPIEGIVAVHVDVGVAAAVGVIVVIIVSRRRGLRAETLDARGKIGIVIRLRGGVHHAVGVGYCLRGLVNGVGIVDVILAVGIIGLIVVFRVAADAGAYVRAVAFGHLTPCIAIRRIVGVVFGRLAIRRAADDSQ
jgi:hypothetical protein